MTLADFLPLPHQIAAGFATAAVLIEIATRLSGRPLSQAIEDSCAIRGTSAKLYSYFNPTHVPAFYLAITCLAWFTFAGLALHAIMPGLSLPLLTSVTAIGAIISARRNARFISRIMTLYLDL